MRKGGETRRPRRKKRERGKITKREREGEKRGRDREEEDKARGIRTDDGDRVASLSYVWGYAPLSIGKLVRAMGAEERDRGKAASFR